MCEEPFKIYKKGPCRYSLNSKCDTITVLGAIEQLNIFEIRPSSELFICNVCFRSLQTFIKNVRLADINKQILQHRNTKLKVKTTPVTHHSFKASVKKYVDESKYDHALALLDKESRSAGTSMKEKFLNDLSKDLNKISCQYTHVNVSNLKTFSWTKFLKEVRECNPMLLETLSAVLSANGKGPFR